MSRPKNDRAIDLGSPLLNDIADAFLKSATIGVTKAAAEDTYYAVKRGSVSSQDFEYTHTQLKLVPKLYRKTRESKPKKMSRPKNDRAIDLGSPLLNDIADAFLKSATIGVTKAAAEDTYYAVKRGSVSSQDFEYTLKNMCKEGAYYGTVAGVFVTTEYGLESVRGRRDWKNTMIAGAMTGAVMSAVNKNNKDKILVDAMVAGTIAGAALFLRNWATGSLRK